MQLDSPLTARTTAIPGLTVVDLTVRGDRRGWFKENWNRAAHVAVGGIPADFRPVQQNVSFNDVVGTVRGIHAEPWDKFVSVAAGRVFGAWVDLREGPSFGATFTLELDPSRAVFVPRGVGNAYQSLAPATSYTYLTNAHWSPAAHYTALTPADETLAIEWPIALADAVVAPEALAHPRLADVVPVTRRRTLVLGADGQIGRALRRLWGDVAHVEYATRADLDLGGDLANARAWGDYDTIVNAAAYTAADAAETAEGRRTAWAVNVRGVQQLAAIATAHAITLVHFSSDYVFDGIQDLPYGETDPVAPVNVYGQTKASGDAVVATVPRHYVLRTSWVVGEGRNFVRTMLDLAERGIDPVVVDDQVGRLTFASTLAEAVDHLLAHAAEPGLYNVTNSGPASSWFDIARDVFRAGGHDPERVQPTTSDEYAARAASPVAPRPRNSVLRLDKAAAAGIELRDAQELLQAYVTRRPAS